VWALGRLDSGLSVYKGRRWVPPPWRHSRSGWMGSEHPVIAVGVPVHCEGVGPDGL